MRIRATINAANARLLLGAALAVAAFLPDVVPAQLPRTNRDSCTDTPASDSGASALQRMLRKVSSFPFSLQRESVLAFADKSPNLWRPALRVVLDACGITSAAALAAAQETLSQQAALAIDPFAPRRVSDAAPSLAAGSAGGFAAVTRNPVDSASRAIAAEAATSALRTWFIDPSSQAPPAPPRGADEHAGPSQTVWAGEAEAPSTADILSDLKAFAATRLRVGVDSTRALVVKLQLPNVFDSAELARLASLTPDILETVLKGLQDQGRANDVTVENVSTIIDSLIAANRIDVRTLLGPLGARLRPQVANRLDSLPAEALLGIVGALHDQVSYIAKSPANLDRVAGDIRSAPERLLRVGSDEAERALEHWHNAIATVEDNRRRAQSDIRRASDSIAAGMKTITARVRGIDSLLARARDGTLPRFRIQRLAIESEQIRGVAEALLTLPQGRVGALVERYRPSSLVVSAVDIKSAFDALQTADSTLRGATQHYLHAGSELVNAAKRLGLPQSVTDAAEKAMAIGDLASQAVSDLLSGNYLGLATNLLGGVFGGGPDPAALRHQQIMEGISAILQTQQQIIKQLYVMDAKLDSLIVWNARNHVEVMQALAELRTMVRGLAEHSADVQLAQLNGCLDFDSRVSRKTLEGDVAQPSYASIREYRARAITASQAMPEAIACERQLSTFWTFTRRGRDQSFDYASFSPSLLLPTVMDTAAYNAFHRMDAGLLRILGDSAVEKVLRQAIAPILEDTALFEPSSAQRGTLPQGAASALASAARGSIIRPVAAIKLAEIVASMSTYLPLRADQREWFRSDSLASGDVNGATVRESTENAQETLARALWIVQVAIVQQAFLGGDRALPILAQRIREPAVVALLRQNPYLAFNTVLAFVCQRVKSRRLTADGDPTILYQQALYRRTEGPLRRLLSDSTDTLGTMVPELKRRHLGSKGDDPAAFSQDSAAAARWDSLTVSGLDALTAAQRDSVAPPVWHFVLANDFEVPLPSYDELRGGRIAIPGTVTLLLRSRDLLLEKIAELRIPQQLRTASERELDSVLIALDIANQLAPRLIGMDDRR